MAVRRIEIKVIMSVDTAEMAAEYGEPPYTKSQVMERLTYDIKGHIEALPYADALSNVEVYAK